MNVLHIISGGDSGGAKTHVFALLDALKKYVNVKIVCFIPGVFYQEIQHKDIQSVLFNQKNRMDLSIITKIENLIKDEKYDIVHVHGARANFIAALLKPRINVPVITTVHSDYKLDFTESLYKKLVFTATNTLALRLMDYYIGVSDNFKRMLVSRGFNPNKVYTVYNGMDYDKPADFCSKEEFAKKYGIDYSPEYTYVGIIGRFDKVKGHEVFIKGAAEVAGKNPNVRFLLAGEGEEKEALIKLAKELGVYDKLHFLGFIKDIYSFLNFVDINTLTSLSESFPYVLLEGAKMKKATVSSAVGGIPDLIKNGKTGMLFENMNHSQFAQKLCTLIENPELRERLGVSLHRFATTCFSSESLALKHVEIYKDVLERHKAKKEYDVIRSGYYGFKNNGDDALLTTIISNLKEQKKDIKIAVLSKRPKETKVQFLVDSMNRFNPFSAICAIRKSKLFLNGGGTLIHDSTSTLSLLYYLTMMKLAKIMGLKVVMYANGIGPVKEKNIKVAGKVCNTVDLITLRDELSLEELKRLNVSKPPIHITADPAITLEAEDSGSISEILKNHGINEEHQNKFIGISLRSWNKNDPDMEEKIAKIIERAYKKYGLIPLFLPMKQSDDLPLCRKIMNMVNIPSYVIDKEYPANVLMGIIKNCRLILGMRLHSLIYATAVSVPVIGLVYDPKISGFLNYVNQSRTTKVYNVDENLINEYIDEIISTEDKIKQELKESTEKLKKLALKNAELTVELLK